MKNSSLDKSLKKYFENDPMLEMTFYHENPSLQSILNHLNIYKTNGHLASLSEVLQGPMLQNFFLIRSG
jgi:hypothetical protein